MKTVPPTSQNRFYADGYDCELPPDVRTLLLGPRRPRILGRPKPAPPATRLPTWLLALAAVILLGALVIWSTSQRKPAHGQVSAPGPIMTPTPAIIPRSDTAPRAVLVQLPVPRAELIRLPQWQVGEQRVVTMPYGLQVLATYKGRLPTTDILPANGNALGDTWAVGDNFWTFITAPGSAAAEWIDP